MAKKRGNREGSIYRTVDGRWRAAVDYGYQNGNRKRSEATKAQPRTEDGRRLPDSSGSPDTILDAERNRNREKPAERVHGWGYSCGAEKQPSYN